jgi:predicted metalloprotease
MSTNRRRDEQGNALGRVLVKLVCVASTLALSACGGSTRQGASTTVAVPAPTAAPEVELTPTIAIPTEAPNEAPTTERPATTSAASKWAPTKPKLVDTSNRGPDAEFVHEAPLDDIVANALLDLDTYWTSVMPELYGQPWQPISGGFFPYTAASALPPCPGVSQYDDIAQNAFYCPAGDLVAWDDEALMPNLQRSYGDFTLAIVMAHEIGHSVQARVAFPATQTVTQEQQADCFAGGWVASVANGHSTRFNVTLADLDAAVAGFLVLRDQPGSSGRAPGAHGSAFDRIGAFEDGFENGAKACADYTDESVAKLLVQVPFNSATDEANGGNMAWEDVLPAISGDLESFWSTVFKQGGKTWTPIDPTERADGVFARRLYYEIGDFAAATLLGRAYASVVQERLGEGGTPLQQSLQADCLTGTWAASMFLQDRPDARLRMSPGDLDKAVMAILVSSDSATAVRDGSATLGSPFQRVEALRTGFLSGISECAHLAEGK